MGFKRASKKQSKLRAAAFGPSGAGKTFTLLRVAKGMGGRIAAIDSERGSMSKYADRFEFDVLELGDDTSIDAYVEAINEAAREGYEIIIIDSLTHAWQELLDEVDKLAKAKYKGNTWAAWSEGTPKQRKLINAILGFNGHVLVTMRSKTEWSVEETSNGKKTPTRVGLAPEQGKGIEYEFDILLEITPEHICTVIKDRTGKFQDKIIEKPGETFGRDLVAWLSEGEAVPESVLDYSIAPIGKNAGKSWKEHSIDALRKAHAHYAAHPENPKSTQYLSSIECAIVAKNATTVPITEKVLSDTVVRVDGDSVAIVKNVAPEKNNGK